MRRGGAMRRGGKAQSGAVAAGSLDGSEFKWCIKFSCCGARDMGDHMLFLRQLGTWGAVVGGAIG